MSDPNDKPSLRVYFITHADGRRTGYLMRRVRMLFEPPPPSAYGETEEDVYGRLEADLQERIVRGDTLERYLFTERYETRTVRFDVHPATMVEAQPVIGARRLPLRLTYAYAKTAAGAFRVTLPRFEWSLVLESLDTAPSAMSNAVAGALLGAEPAWLYDFRHEGDEYVREWTPGLVKEHQAGRSPSPPAGIERPTLSAVADDWIERVERGRLPKPVGAPRLDVYWKSFVRRPHSALLVGGPGVGKTTEIQHLARTLLSARRAKQVVPGLFATRADRLVAGMIYVGMWQERMLQLVEELRDENDLLYVDRLGPLLRPQPDGASLADLLAPAVAAREVHILAECTPAELVAARRQNAAFVDLLQQVHLPEPSTGWMLPHLQEFAQRGKKRFERRSLKRLVELLAAYRRDRRFPGKAFQFIEAIERDADAPRALHPPDVEAAFARSTGLPLELIGEKHAAPVDHVARELAKSVVGQDDACTRAARAIAPFKAGLNPPDRPLASLLFAGPTGVGKTELSKTITRYLFGSTERLVRVDMSELGARGASQRLLAAGRGVRSLAESVRREPLSVVLFDEIEKAAGDAFDVLLGILGEGRLTDSLGRFVDFRMTLIVMTSNLGVRTQGPVGFDAAEGSADFLRAIREHFRPEFVGRIDQVVPFAALTPESVRRIVDLQLNEVLEREGFRRRGIRVNVTSAARDRLAELGYDPRFGARPLGRVIESRVVTPIAVRLAADPKLRDATLRVGTAPSDDVTIE